MEPDTQQSPRGRALLTIGWLWFIVTGMCGMTGWVVSWIASIPGFIVGGALSYPLALMSDRRPWLSPLHSIVHTAFIGLIAGGSGAAVLGLAQAMLLRAYIDRARYWIVVTVIGGAVGGLAYGLLISQISAPLYETAGHLADAFAYAIGGVVATTVGTTGQYIVLRRSLHRANWWLVASTASWAIAWVITYQVEIRREPSYGSWGIWWMVWPIGGLLTALSFLVLVWMQESRTAIQS